LESLERFRSRRIISQKMDSNNEKPLSANLVLFGESPVSHHLHVSAHVGLQKHPLQLL
jgi:hypothetical protein